LLFGCLDGWFLGCFLFCLALVDWLFGFFVDWLFGWFVVWLVCCLAGWLVVWIVGWLIDSLDVWLLVVMLLVYWLFWLF